MSARAPRRSFAAPFVITLATIPACSGPNKPVEPPHENPPPPKPDPDKPDKPDEAKVTPPAWNPPPPGTDPASPGAKTEPATYDQKWTVMRPTGKDCQAIPEANCPKPEKGKPVATCNPPPPMKYTCPTEFKQGDTLKIILRAGATDCYVDLPPISCPKGEPGKERPTCNPPAPRKVDCPTRS